nr:hypothetical protein [uncultured Desulfobulbus sp.]
MVETNLKNLLQDTAVEIYNFLVKNIENTTALIKLKKDTENYDVIKKGGRSRFELLYHRVQYIENALLTDEEIISKANEGNCSATTLYEILSRRIVSEEDFSKLILNIIYKNNNYISDSELIRISMRINSKKIYYKIVNSLSPLNISCESLLNSCNNYKYKNESIEKIRIKNKASSRVKNLSLKLRRQDVVDILSLQCENYKFIYDQKFLYFRTLEAVYFGCKLLPESFMTEESIFKLIYSQMRGVISSWVLSYNDTVISGECFEKGHVECLINNSDMEMLLSSLKLCENGGVFLISHRLSNLFLTKILDALDIDFVVYANDGACFYQAIGNPRRLFCSSIWSDVESVKNIKKHARDKKIIITLTDPAYGGKSYIHATSNGGVPFDLHGFGLSKALKLPLFFMSLIWDNNKKEYRILLDKNNNTDSRGSIESYVSWSQDDWVKSIEFENCTVCPH